MRMMRIMMGFLGCASLLPSDQESRSAEDVSDDTSEEDESPGPIIMIDHEAIESCTLAVVAEDDTILGEEETPSLGLEQSGRTDPGQDDGAAQSHLPTARGGDETESSKRSLSPSKRVLR